MERVGGIRGEENRVESSGDRKRVSAIANLPYAFSGFSGLATIIYSACRQFFDNGMCWVSPSEFFWIEWIIMGPCLFALCVCFKSCGLN